MTACLTCTESPLLHSNPSYQVQTRQKIFLFTEKSYNAFSEKRANAL